MLNMQRGRMTMETKTIDQIRQSGQEAKSLLVTAQLEIHAVVRAMHVNDAEMAEKTGSFVTTDA